MADRCSPVNIVTPIGTNRLGKTMNAKIVTFSCALACAAGLRGFSDNEGEKKAVMATMDAMRKATIAKDIVTLGKIYRDNLIFGHSGGKMQTKAEVLATVKGNAEVWESIDFSNTSVRIYGSVALFKGICDIKSGPPGKPEFHHLDILWILVKGPQHWQIFARQATKVPIQ